MCLNTPRMYPCSWYFLVISILVGDEGQDKDGDVVITPWAMEMTLWDTVTNEMTLVPHPPGYDGDDQNTTR